MTLKDCDALMRIASHYDATPDGLEMMAQSKAFQTRFPGATLHAGVITFEDGSTADVVFPAGGEPGLLVRRG